LTIVSREYCHKSAQLPRESRDPPEHGATAEGLTWRRQTPSPRLIAALERPGDRDAAGRERWEGAVVPRPGVHCAAANRFPIRVQNNLRCRREGAATRSPRRLVPVSADGANAQAAERMLGD